MTEKEEIERIVAGLCDLEREWIKDQNN